MENIATMFQHYGYAVLYFGLMAELIAIPTPSAPILVYCGVLISSGKLNVLLSLFFAFAGICTGSTITYFIGDKVGHNLFYKYGHYIHLGPDKLDKSSKWFEKYGDKLLFVSCFIPVVRHMAGYFAGIIKIPFKIFATYSYIGALIYVCIYIAIGYVLGEKWKIFFMLASKYYIPILIVLVIILILYIIYFRHKNSTKKNLK